MSEPGRPPRLVHEIDRRTRGHACLKCQSQIARRAHRVPGIAGYAEVLAQRGIALETACGEQHTGAGTDCAATAVLLDHGADDAVVRGDQLNQRAIEMKRYVRISGDRRQQPADERPPADEVFRVSAPSRSLSNGPRIR